MQEDAPPPKASPLSVKQKDKAVKTPPPRLYLINGWEYSVDESNFHSLDQKDLQNLQNLLPGGTGVIYLRYVFTLPKELRGKDLSCYLGKVTMADQTFINGSYIGGEGRFGPDNEFSAWNTPRLYPIPSSLLGTIPNILQVKIWVNGEGSIVAAPFIGLPQDAKHVERIQTFWSSRIHLLFAFFMLIIALYHFMIYAKRPAEKENLIFSLINIVSVVYLSAFYLWELPGLPSPNMSFLWFQKIVSNVFMYIIPFMVTSFVNSFLRRKENPIILFLRILLVLVPSVVALTVSNYPMLHYVRSWIQPLLVPPMLYILYVLFSSRKKGKSETKALILGFSPVVLTVLADLVLHSVLRIDDFPYITSIGWQLAIISLLFIMANRFSDARREAEFLNKHLEQKVKDRTHDLETANEKLSVTNEKLEESNNQLEEAKKRADMDMQLAVNVQKSFYPKKAPDIDGWDIAYIFNPMAGVSGDLYDFFSRGKTLLGLALFDVSGHGIAAGLVTMLAKNIIEKKFIEGLGKPLGQTVANINATMVQDKGDIENYMTGVILRMHDSTVECVNAGHPMVFWRSAKSGNVHPVVLSNAKEGQGMNSVVGLLDINEFHALKFNMRAGDALILYTDCLSESRNKDGAEFGQDGVSKAFAEVKGESAQEKLDEVLKTFKSFIGKTPVNDDLSIIVLQKK